jgi:predicted transcriptional regulator
MAASTKKNLSDLELELLRFLAVSGPKSARAAAEEFGEPNGYARTTVMTLLERLRQKGYLDRSKVAGVYVHSSKLTPGELMRNVVGRFVQRALGGSVSPLVAFLAENPKLTDAEIAELRRLVDELGGSK